MPEIDLEKKINHEFIKLNDGSKCPIMGLGTELIEQENVVYQSIKDGVRLIDTAPPNEELVGKGIKRAIEENIVKRKDLFIVTKLELEEKENPEEALRKSLKRLQLDYVDLYLDHWPSCICLNDINKYKLIPVKDTWELMEKLVDLGLTKSIGISNYNVENIFNILPKCRIKPVVNEVEFHLLLYQEDLKEFCDKKQIVLFAYNPLGKDEYVDKNMIIDKSLDLLKDKTVINLKEKYPRLSKSQIILNWHLSLGVVPIVGTSKDDVMKENLKAKNFKISDNIVKIMGAPESEHHRFNDGSDIFGINIFA